MMGHWVDCRQVSLLLLYLFEALGETVTSTLQTWCTSHWPRLNPALPLSLAFYLGVSRRLAGLHQLKELLHANGEPAGGGGEREMADKD